jgi:hypothetical protein
MTRKWTAAKSVVALVLAVNAAGCQTKTQTGALVGGAGGAGIGAAIGSSSGNAGKGALIGGLVGVVGGGLVGHGMDKQDEARQREQRDREQRERLAERRRYEDRAARESEQAGREDHHFASATAGVSRDDVIDWTQDGVSDEVIIDRIRRGDTVFRLTARDENTLRQEGVSADVIDEMKETARR